MFRERTGLLLDAYFSGTKLKWLLDEVPGLCARAEFGGLAFGTVGSWLIARLTGGRVHATDFTNASRTLMFNIHYRTWDPDLLHFLDIPLALLPQGVPSAHVAGWTDPAIVGAVVQCLRDGLGLIHAAEETLALAESVADAQGAYVVPAFAGLGAPHSEKTFFPKIDADGRRRLYHGWADAVERVKSRP